MKLTLEINKGFAPTDRELGLIAGGMIMMTPAIGKDGYWKYRVKLHKNGQAILGFPKFGVCIGIGFAKESSWNTNLPSDCGAEVIYNHISRNKGSKSISRAKCIEAIKMIQVAVVESTPQPKINRREFGGVVSKLV